MTQTEQEKVMVEMILLSLAVSISTIFIYYTVNYFEVFEATPEIGACYANRFNDGKYTTLSKVISIDDSLDLPEVTYEVLTKAKRFQSDENYNYFKEKTKTRYRKMFKHIYNDEIDCFEFYSVKLEVITNNIGKK
jgi:hypothetical protein